VREAINNALIHRDYTRLGAVHIQLHDDHVRISNPGGFVEGVRPGNLLVTEPRPRNLRLADAFKRVGLVEHTGRGVETIYRGQLRAGRRPPDYTPSTIASVSVILDASQADLDFVRVTIQLAQAIMAHVRARKKITRREVIERCSVTEKQAEYLLKRLVTIGRLQLVGKGRNAHYVLAESV
jgi:ATP-dependent DNA helicase RecG